MSVKQSFVFVSCTIFSVSVIADHSISQFLTPDNLSTTLKEAPAPDDQVLVKFNPLTINSTRDESLSKTKLSGGTSSSSSFSLAAMNETGSSLYIYVAGNGVSTLSAGSCNVPIGATRNCTFSGSIATNSNYIYVVESSSNPGITTVSQFDALPANQKYTVNCSTNHSVFVFQPGASAYQTLSGTSYSFTLEGGTCTLVTA